ncbi:hypothetical protein AURDEDRAFT_44492, partial [Auricularia subglabra TFB-10046 SS5]
NLYHFFSSTPGLVQEAVLAVLASLERHWAQADQDIFILALVLNPYIRTSCFARNSPFRVGANICALAEAAFKRFYGVDPGAAFGDELIAHLQKQGSWSDDRMKLKHLKDQAKKEQHEVNLLRIWREWTPISGDDDVAAPSDLPATGAGCLALLAMRILAMVPNSAAVECIFSLYRIIHMPHRNRLSKEKVHKQTIIRVDTAQKFPGCVRWKHKFGDDLDEDEEDDAE